LNPRILVLQTSALATSPPVPICSCRVSGRNRHITSSIQPNETDPIFNQFSFQKAKNPQLAKQAGRIKAVLEELSALETLRRVAATTAARREFLEVSSHEKHSPITLLLSCGVFSA
jgi:hypothetical protein